MRQVEAPVPPEPYPEQVEIIDKLKKEISQALLNCDTHTKRIAEQDSLICLQTEELDELRKKSTKETGPSEPVDRQDEYKMALNDVLSLIQSFDLTDNPAAELGPPVCLVV